MAEMTFWDHLDELRRVLFRVIGVWFVLAVGYFIAMPYLFDNVVLAPCHNDFVFYDLLRYIGKTFDLTDDFFTQEFQVKLVKTDKNKRSSRLIWLLLFLYICLRHSGCR